MYVTAARSAVKQRGGRWHGVGNKYVHLESPAGASHWPNITRSQRNREPGEAVTENPEGPEQDMSLRSSLVFLPSSVRF